MQATVNELQVEKKYEVDPNKAPQKPLSKRIKRALVNQKGYLYMLPALVFLAVFTIYPIFNTVIIAFKNNYNSLTDSYDGVGFANFIYVCQFPLFITCLVNTLLFAFISVPISTILALLISVWLNSIKWLQKLYQTIFFLPYLTNAIAVGAVFMAMFNVVSLTGNIYDPVTGEQVASSIGFINTILGWFGITPIKWVSAGASDWASRTVVILYSIWAALPFKILILFSSLQSVNKQYYDAAKIDGASKVRTLLHVTIPLISPMLSYLVVTGFIGGFKEYTSIVGIFGDTMGQPGNSGSMNTMVGFIYEMLNDNRLGLASAGAIILFAIILLFTLINQIISKKRVHY